MRRRRLTVCLFVPIGWSVLVPRTKVVQRVTLENLAVIDKAWAAI